MAAAMRARVRWLAIAVGIAVIALGGLLLAGRRGDNAVGDRTGGATPPNAQNDHRPAAELPVAAARPPAAEPPFQGCPPRGDGGDPVLNMLKNRTDSGDWQPVSFAALAKLAWPSRAERGHYDAWPRDVRAQIDRYNGMPVAVEGYLWGARQQRPESNNCHSTALTDYHIWLTAAPGQDRGQAIVVEATPRLLVEHPRWTVEALNRIARDNERVRISGWTMFDPEHADQLTRTRGTLWEIHPVMQIEVQRNGRWQSLDDAR